ncbi:hypothetical protein ACWOAH_01665 [Vagococcus vulneris]|uniref:Uncharacterized protein n=1 Tax=Vagococcus vulneris TaxID=1977869 RepID=A0A430A1G2_9ENTE|nr:hypothetical protein [Vagococcus vulneris]RSU00220.1 hypothetical protein CBF37_02680 [Vagococcus vulneris]
MNQEELLAKVQELIDKGNIDAATEFVSSNKEALGSYFEKANDLLTNNEGVNDLLDQAKELLSSNENGSGLFETIKGFFNK